MAAPANQWDGIITRAEVLAELARQKAERERLRAVRIASPRRQRKPKAPARRTAADLVKRALEQYARGAARRQDAGVPCAALSTFEQPTRVRGQRPRVVLRDAAGAVLATYSIDLVSRELEPVSTLRFGTARCAGELYRNVVNADAAGQLWIRTGALADLARHPHAELVLAARVLRQVGALAPVDAVPAGPEYLLSAAGADLVLRGVDAPRPAWVLCASAFQRAAAFQPEPFDACVHGPRRSDRPP